MRILKSSQDPRSHIQVVEADENSAFTSNEPFLSRDTLVIPSSKDPAAAKLSAGFGHDGEPNSDAEKTLDSEQGTPNSSYVNINLCEGEGLRCKQFSIARRFRRKFSPGTFTCIINFQAE